MSEDPSEKKFRGFKYSVLALLFLAAIGFVYFAKDHFKSDRQAAGLKEKVSDTLTDARQYGEKAMTSTFQGWKNSGRGVNAKSTNLGPEADNAGISAFNPIDATAAKTVEGVPQAGSFRDESAKKQFFPKEGVGILNYSTNKKGRKIAKQCAGIPVKGKDLGDRYIVAYCETMGIISERTGVNVQDLIERNPQIKDPNLIYPNQKLWLPPRS